MPSLQQVARIWLLFSLVLFLALGLGLIVVGALALSSLETFNSSVLETLESDVSNISIYVVVVGSVIFLTSILGIVGAARRTKKFLGCYALFMALIFVASVTGVVLVVIKFDSNLDSTIDDALTNQWENATPEARNQIQQDFKCCGYGELDPSCSATYQITCRDAISQKITDVSAPIQITAIVVVVLEVLSLIAAFILIKANSAFDDDAWFASEYHDSYLE
jgi:hypothetical protein